MRLYSLQASFNSLSVAQLALLTRRRPSKPTYLEAKFNYAVNDDDSNADRTLALLARVPLENVA